MGQINRRRFLQSAAALGLLAGNLPVLGAEATQPKRSATDWVTLGRSGVRVTRLGMGTGSNGGQHQREMGQEKFAEMVRHAYDRGIRFFDTADNYDQMHEWLAQALKGIDRNSYRIQTKMKIYPDQDVAKTIDQFRKELNSDYFDSLLLHCTRTLEWPDELKRLRDQLSECKEKQMIRSHGASVHGLSPLRGTPACVDWLDVALLRVNHLGTKMDGPTGEWMEDGKPFHDEAVEGIRRVHAAGAGVIGMKLIGNGEFTKPEDRDASIRYVMGLDCVDAVIIGFKSIQEVDEAIERINTHLNA